jgi:threonine aldolase
LVAYIESGVWHRNASRANALAQRLAAHAGRWLLYPVESNELFLDLGTLAKERLRAEGFEFFDWAAADSGQARLVVSWDQAEEEVSALCAALDRL